MDPTPRAVVVEATRPAIGSPVALVNVPEAGVPKAGATKVLLLKVWARVLKVKVSETLAKLGMVKVVVPTVWAAKLTVAV